MEREESKGLLKKRGKERERRGPRRKLGFCNVRFR